MSVSGADGTEDRATFDRLLGELRPKLHRCCARMTGSVIDGEDVVQEALVKAIKAYPQAGPVADLEGWLFRITHNAALDFLRRRTRQEATRSDEDPDMIAETTSTAQDRQITTASLRTFMRLPVAQRRSVILMDVFGYSLQKIGGVMDQYSRCESRAESWSRAPPRTGKEPEDLLVPVLAAPERSLLAAYVDRFNARDFDAIGDMLADEVRLELVNRGRMNGRREVGKYFHNCGLVDGWHFVLALVDRRPALVVPDPGDPSATTEYFVLLQWAGDRFTNIRDFRHARYVTEGAEVVIPS
jgi:RNA polymerase sigma-70 factor, ECF subfamily